MHSFKRRGILKINDQFLLAVFHPKLFEFELEVHPPKVPRGAEKSSTLLPIMSHTCSIGDKSGDLAGHGCKLTLFSFKTLRNVWPSVDLLKNTVAMPLMVWQQNWLQSFVDVPGRIQTSLKED
jgi:hypothetical protein